jgi:hypothetical protein
MKMSRQPDLATLCEIDAELAQGERLAVHRFTETPNRSISLF